MLSRLFIAALWSPAGKGLNSWLLSVIIIVILLLGQVWYLIVSVPDLCRLSYLDVWRIIVTYHKGKLSN